MQPLKYGRDAQAFMQKKATQALQPLSILGSIVFPTISFAWIYYCTAFELRYTPLAEREGAWSVGFLIGPILFFFICVLITLYTISKLITYMGGGKSILNGVEVVFDDVLLTQSKQRNSHRFWISLGLCMWGALTAGICMGERNYWLYSAKYLTYGDMATYVNIDPGMDRGQAFMDAGQIYFKESSYVATVRSIAFKNGATYCAAPIVRAPLVNQEGAATQSVSGFVAPPSGTVDFWAVGSDCCDLDGTNFKCGQTESTLARSGLRLLNDNARPMYLLAVQEWSASTGLPVRHPLFFEWVKDPLKEVRGLQDDARNAWKSLVFICFGVNTGIAILLNVFMQKLRLT